MPQTNCLIIDDLDPILITKLNQAGIITSYQPDISPAQLAGILPDYQGLVVRSKIFIGPELIDAAPKLRFIGRAGAGLDMIDIEYARGRGIAVFHAAKGNRDAVGEHSIALMLGLLNRLQVAHTQVSKGIWEREANRGTEIFGKTIGIIGYGNMGSALAMRLSGFGVRVIAYDKYLPIFDNPYALPVSLDGLFAQTDILSLHIPLSTETKGMIDYDFLSNFHKPIWLINTSRGEIVSLKDLFKLLNENKILGAGLDVLENEKPSTFSPEYLALLDALANTGKVYFSPHVAGWSFESYHKISLELSHQIINYCNG